MTGDALEPGGLPVNPRDFAVVVGIDHYPDFRCLRGATAVRVGFRKIEARDGHIYLNGHPIFLRGLAINPPGRTVPEALGSSRQFAYDYVKYMKGQNLNLIRVNEPNQDWFDGGVER